MLTIYTAFEADLTALRPIHNPHTRDWIPSKWIVCARERSDLMCGLNCIVCPEACWRDFQFGAQSQGGSLRRKQNLRRERERERRSEWGWKRESANIQREFVERFSQSCADCSVLHRQRPRLFTPEHSSISWESWTFYKGISFERQQYVSFLFIYLHFTVSFTEFLKITPII